MRSDLLGFTRIRLDEVGGDPSGGVDPLHRYKPHKQLALPLPICTAPIHAYPRLEVVPTFSTPLLERLLVGFVEQVIFAEGLEGIIVGAAKAEVQMPAPGFGVL